MSATVIKYSRAGGRLAAKYIQYFHVCVRARVRACVCVCRGAHLRLCACNSTCTDECACMFVTTSAICVTHQ